MNAEHTMARTIEPGSATAESRAAWIKKNLHPPPCAHCDFIRTVVAMLDAIQEVHGSDQVATDRAGQP